MDEQERSPGENGEEAPGELDEDLDVVELHRRAMRQSGNSPQYAHELTRDEHGNWLVDGDPDHPLALVRRSVGRPW